MMPGCFEKSKTSVFNDLETLRREERARRRILRIQQVRQQSKLIASRVLSENLLLRDREEKLLLQKKEDIVQEWKHERLMTLRSKLNHGLEKMGDAFRAVDEELAQHDERQLKKEYLSDLSRKRGSVAAHELQRQLDDLKLAEERIQKNRKVVRATENLRSKVITSLPARPCEETVQIETGAKQTVEVYDYRLPLPPRIVQLPENVVTKVPLEITQTALEELRRKVDEEEAREQEKRFTLLLEKAAASRSALQKDYERLQDRLHRLEAPLIEQQERNQRFVDERPMDSQADGEENNPPWQDLTAFPISQLTAEESGTLGANASSLQALLGSLVNESRRRLQEVIDVDFDFTDDVDFESPPASPPPSAPDKDSSPYTQPPERDHLSLGVQTTHQLSVAGPSHGVATSMAEVNVSVTTTTKSKRRKKKGKRKQVLDVADGNEPSEDQKKSCLELPGEEASLTSDLGSQSADMDSGVTHVKKSRTDTSPERNGNTHKLSLVSDSTQYRSLPEQMLGQDLDQYLQAIEKEKEKMEAFLQSNANKPPVSADINLPGYIDKLLTMTRGSVATLSVSDITESSAEVSKSRHRKKKKKRRPKESTSTPSDGSPSTMDSHLTLSVPSTGSFGTGGTSDVSPVAEGTSSTSLDSHLKFSEQSSVKEASPLLPQTLAGVDTTSYLSLHDLSQQIPGKVTFDLPLLGATGVPPENMDIADSIIRPLENVRLSTIIEGGSSCSDTSSSMLDVEAELRKRGLPTLNASILGSGGLDSDVPLLSPELERKLREMKVAPWSSVMLARMQQAQGGNTSSSSCSSEAVVPCATKELPLGNEQGITHSTPVSLEGASTSQPSGSHRTLIPDPDVSPIVPTDDAGRPLFS